MKKKASIFSISLLIIGGLILAVPFSPLRKSFLNEISKYTNKTLTSLAVGVNNPRNITIAGYLSNSFENKQPTNLIGTSSNSTKGYQIANNELDPYNDISTRTNTNGQQLITSDILFLQNNTRKISSTSNNVPPIGNGSIARSANNPNRTAGTSIKSNQTIAMSGTSSNSSAAASSVRQLAGGAPPPSENEIIGTLPIGDGYVFMLILVSIVGFIKSRKLAF